MATSGTMPFVTVNWSGADWVSLPELSLAAMTRPTTSGEFIVAINTNSSEVDDSDMTSLRNDKESLITVIVPLTPSTLVKNSISASVALAIVPSASVIRARISKGWPTKNSSPAAGLKISICGTAPRTTPSVTTSESVELPRSSVARAIKFSTPASATLGVRLRRY